MVLNILYKYYIHKLNRETWNFTYLPKSSIKQIIKIDIPKPHIRYNKSILALDKMILN